MSYNSCNNMREITRICKVPFVFMMSVELESIEEMNAFGVEWTPSVGVLESKSWKRKRDNKLLTIKGKRKVGLFPQA